MQKNRVLLILLMLTLMMPTFAEEPASSGGLNQVAEEQNADDVVMPQDIEPNAAMPYVEESSTMLGEQLKQPVSKKKIAKKFLFAMSGVGISSVLLFIILTVYNKLRNALFSNQQENPNGETSLVTPENLTNAVKTFIDKTKWD